MTVKNNRIRSAFAPDYGREYIRMQLLERSETKIKIFEIHVNGEEVPYSDTFEIWMIWEVLTTPPQDDAVSNQVVFRKQYHLHWIDEPIVSGAIESAVVEGTVSYNDLLPPFFQ